ncbi:MULTISPECIES: hypothetical protein [Micromonosporaceae]|uniref:hypothetical protein n=1 Tax=Micromonosporaceae TaxID=28056 RepID=UPI0033F32C22
MSFYISDFVADVGAANAAWFADADNTLGESVAVDNGDGTVTIDEDQVGLLGELYGDDEVPGSLGENEDGLFVRLPYEHPDGSGNTEFRLTERFLPASRAHGGAGLRSRH